eukprot:31465-Pelagococcus_subviridis.AAC.3
MCASRFECEHTCWDPKDGELCLSRAKSEETLMEARSDTDVQIVRRTWTAGRWSWKSKSAKECVTTHLPNELAPKMDGA